MFSFFKSLFKFMTLTVMMARPASSTSRSLNKDLAQKDLYCKGEGFSLRAYCRDKTVGTKWSE